MKKSKASDAKKKRDTTPFYIGAGLIAIALVLIFWKDIFPEKKELKIDTISSPTNIEQRFRNDGTLVFKDNSGNKLAEISIEIADNEESRTQGLMGRKNIAEDQGMLFIFPDEQERSFWMVNTPLSLDIIFVNANKKIVKIQKNAKPYSDQSLPSEKPAQYTVEVNSGFCSRNGIQEEDAVEWMRR